MSIIKHIPCQQWHKKEQCTNYMKIFTWQVQCWTKENRKTSCLNWSEFEWYWSLIGNKPQKIFVPSDFKVKCQSMSSYVNKNLKLQVYKVIPTQEIFPQTGKQEGGIKVIWNTDSQLNFLSRVWPPFISGRGMVLSKWGYKQPK